MGSPGKCSRCEAKLPPSLFHRALSVAFFTYANNIRSNVVLLVSKFSLLLLILGLTPPAPDARNLFNSLQNSDLQTNRLRLELGSIRIAQAFMTQSRINVVIFCVIYIGKSAETLVILCLVLKQTAPNVLPPWNNFSRDNFITTIFCSGIFIISKVRFLLIQSTAVTGKYFVKARFS